MIFIKYEEIKECPKCGGSSIYIYADLKDGVDFNSIEEMYDGKKQIEDLFYFIKYCCKDVNNEKKCYFNEWNFQFSKEDKKELFKLLKEELFKKRLNKEEFEKLNGEKFKDKNDKGDEKIEVEYIIKGNKRDIENLEVLLDWIHYLSSVGSTRTITLEVDGDGPTYLRIKRKDGKELNSNVTGYGHQIKDSCGDLKKLFI